MNLLDPLYKAMLRTDVKVVQNPYDASRWFITIGNPGFNSPTNNALGYKSKASAEKAIRAYNVLRLSTRMVDCSAKSPLLYNPRS